MVVAKNNVCLTCTMIILMLCHYRTVAQNTESQKNNPFTLNSKEKLFKPIVVFENWITYSMNENSNANRLDNQVRRLRFGATGNPYPWLNYHFQLHFDRLGEDSYSSTKGSYAGVDIWDACISAKLLQQSDLIYVHAGYYWAAISREYNTAAWAQGSFDRTRANWFMRNFMTGKGNGIESGIGLGGLKNFEKIGISYRIGSFEPAAYASSRYASRLNTAHIIFLLGEPEQTSYKYRLPGNHWQKRKGISLGFGASSQTNGRLNDTTYFDQSLAYGADLLINFAGLRIDGEYFKLKRTSEGLDDYSGTEWHIRAGYTFEYKQTFIEPTVTYDKYEGEGNKRLFKYIGNDETLDIGVNWYLNRDKLKLALHYLIQSGSVASNTGDYIGFAFQVKL
ncbi:porin [Saccharicrinis sp. FJH54]|uniref:porin n=1 Tax=Saccharicrinis sp. FJH54 TaxID=3344665 RepID=UPI0035D4201E